MIIESGNIRTDIKKIWPDLKFIILTDSKFYRPSLLEVKKFLGNDTTDEDEFIDNFRACEEFALKLLLQSRKKEHGFPYNWSFGFVWGTHFQSYKESHFCNIVICESGIYLIEPQTDEIWRPNDKQDKVHFIFM